MVTRTDGPFEYWKVTGDAIRAAGEKPGSDAAVIQSLAGELEGDEKNAAAAIEGDIEAGVKANTTAAKTAAQNLAAKGQYAVGLLNQFAGFVDDFDREVNEINVEYKKRYDSTIFGMHHMPEYRSGEEKIDYKGIAASIQADLKGRYSKAEATIDDAADGIASKFKQGPTDANVRELIRAGLIPLTSAGLWPGLALTPEDKYAYYRSRMDAGLMPDFAHMTEEQRTAFIDENPGLLESWLQIKDPGKGLQADIIALALPHVDGDDAKGDVSKILGVLGDDANVSPADFLNAFHNVSGINEGLALLAPWAAKNGVDLASNATVGNAQSYLKTFVEGTYSKKDDILDYINANEHEWKTGQQRDYPYSPYGGPSGSYDVTDKVGGFTDSWKDMLQEDYANSILNLSNTDVGGSYDDLPEDLRHDAREMFTSEMKGSIGGAYWTFDDNEHFKSLAELLVHGDAEPGDGLAKQMASTAIASTDAYETFWDKQPGGDRQGQWDTGLTADILDMVSRNRDATADLVSGVDVPDNYPSNFNATILDEPWDLENGEEAKAAKMYSWIHDDAISGDPAAVARADQAFDKLTQDITAVDGDNFKHLMGEDGDSAAFRNTLITREITDALSDHLGEFAAETGTPEANKSPLSEADRIRLMTYIASDNVLGNDHPSQFDAERGANRLATYVNAYQHDQIFKWAANPDDNPRTLADSNGRLQAYLDAGLVNAAQEHGLNANDAEAERVRNLKIASGIVSTLAGKIPVAGDFLGPATGIGNTLLANLTTAEHFPAPNADLGYDWQPDGSHVTTHNTVTMIDALVESGKLDPATLPSVLKDNPGHASNAALQDAADTVLTKYFRDNPPHDDTFYTDFSEQIGDVYKFYSDHYSLTGMDDNHIKEFLTSKGWGRP
ncbi:hypothetical protein [Aeromicrobium sp. 9AM]|uniref:TPR repeat region-containing protein n=1 Tax=Aeromicrobium sp. 9AM TaxID=2653126 RepID=UPI0012F00602|nr:hypothetical protein [Aeromicrobium sp. 9AM]VXC43780.1 conserved hypothetical protein [Aeromicrobium sp. 9AM]